MRLLASQERLQYLEIVAGVAVAQSPQCILQKACRPPVLEQLFRRQRIRRLVSVSSLGIFHVQGKDSQPTPTLLRSFRLEPIGKEVGHRGQQKRPEVPFGTSDPGEIVLSQYGDEDCSASGWDCSMPRCSLCIRNSWRRRS